MAAAAATRTFLKLMLESNFQDDSLKNMSLHLVAERERFSGLTRPPTAGPAQVAYDEEEKVLKLEEKLLYQLAQYLQTIKYIKTNTESSATTTTDEDK